MRYSADYKQIALNSLRGKWPVAVLTGFVASLIGGSTVSVSGSSDGGNTLSSLLEKLEGSEVFSQIYSSLVGFTVAWLFFAIAIIIIGGAAQLGYATFNLKLVDKRDASFSDLFSQFNRIGDGFCMNILRGLYVFLWSMLFVIPGIVKQYSYAMTPYILAENRGMGTNQAITESRRIMNGNKWRLFCLELSFIGWELLCLAPIVVGVITLYKTAVNGGSLGVFLWLIPCFILTVIGFLFLSPYIEATRAAFYRDISHDPNADVAYVID